jgi:hypothetical protein
MRRREFIVGLGGAAVTWPLAVRAQQPTLPVIGYLSSTSSSPHAPFEAAFQQGLRSVYGGCGRAGTVGLGRRGAAAVAGAGEVCNNVCESVPKCSLVPICVQNRYEGP